MISSNCYPHLFQPIQIGPVRLKNRLGFAPMVCNQCTIDGTVTDAMVDFIYRQASTGVAYVTIGDTQVDDERGGAFMSTLNIARKTSLPGLIRLTEAASFGGAVLSVELNHSGRGAKDDLINGPALAPSAIPFPRCSQNVKAMDADDLERVKGLFVHCAKQCKAAGFPMVMVHCAHNNLLGQFLSPLSNHRTDAYGGSPENRRRYPLEVLQAIREVVGPDLAIEVRVSATEMIPGGLEFEESLAFMKEAQRYCDLMHVSRGIVYNDPGIYTLPTFLQPHCLNADYARRVKAELDIPVATVGNVTTLAEAEELVASGAADIVCMARFHLADLEALSKSVAGAPEKARPCVRCHRGCIDNSSRGKAIHCSVNPGLGFEDFERRLPPVRIPKQVLVIGGGPAGMVAAQTLRRRGHTVMLCEATRRLGGKLIDAAAPECKGYMKRYLEWLDRETKECGAIIQFNAKITPELVENLSPDAILVATGSVYLRPSIPGIDLPHVVMLADFHRTPGQAGQRVVVCGGGSAGLECALDLARAGKAVTVVDQLPLESFASGMPYFPRLDLLQQLEQAGAVLLPEHTVTSFTDGGVQVSGADGAPTLLPADTAIVALGVRPNNQLGQTLEAKYATGVRCVGDCAGGKNLYDATHSAYFAALSIC